MTTDLSQHHEYLTDHFPNLPADTTTYQLTPQQIQFFDDHGFLTGVKILNERQLQALREELDRFFEPGHDGQHLWYEYHANESADPQTVLFHALGAWRIGPTFHDLLWAPAFTVPASQLLRGAVRFWHDQLFCKPSHHGGVVSWHQDYSYWTRTQPVAHLTCWIALDDSTIENGCVYYVPGSHRWDLLPITGLAGDMDAIRTVLTDEQWQQFTHPVPAELKAGECSFHHSFTIHGSRENRTNRSRRATVINVMRDGVRSASNEPLLDGVPPVPSGQPVQGQFFPLLYDPTPS